MNLCCLPDSETIVGRLNSHVFSLGSSRAVAFHTPEKPLEELSYCQLWARATTIAYRLAAFAEPGERAILMYSPGLAFLEAFWGCLLAGIVAVPAYPPRRKRGSGRVYSIAEDCKPSLILCDSKVAQDVAATRAGCLGNATLVVTDQVVVSRPIELSTVRLDQLAVLQYTSGSTAQPKGVMISHGNLVANERFIEHKFGFTKQSIMVSWLPTFHDMGLIGGLLAPLYVGFPTIILSPISFLSSPFTWLKAVSDFGATVTGSPNFAYDLCVDQISDDMKPQLDLSRVEVAFNGSEPVQARTLRRFSDAFRQCGFRSKSFFPCYGLAEATLLVSGGPVLCDTPILCADPNALETHKVVPSSGGRELVSCGQIDAEVEVRITRPGTNDLCDDDEVGEVCLRGESLSCGYYQGTDHSSASPLQSQASDWLRTGDLGFVRDSRLYITGRLKDVLIIRGRNLYPQDIEASLAEFVDGPNSIAVVSLEMDNQPELAVVIEASRVQMRLLRSKNKQSDASDDLSWSDLYALVLKIRRKVSAEFDVSPKTVALAALGEFPRTSSGKVKRHACKLALEGRGGPTLYMLPISQILPTNQAN